MTKDEIFSLAREAGLYQKLEDRIGVDSELQAFAALVAEKEREQAEDRVTDLFEKLENPYLPDIAAAIRARGNK